MDNVDFTVAERLFFVSSMQPSYELHAQVQQTSFGRRLSVSVELQSYDVANPRPRPWPMFEFTQEIIQPKLHLASVLGHYCTTHVVFKQISSSQLYLQIGHMRFTCDELCNAPGTNNLEFTDPATYFASLLLTSPAINHTGFSYSSTTATTLKPQFTVCPTESLRPGLLLYEEDGQQYDNKLFQLVSEHMSHTVVIPQFIFTLHDGHSSEFCNPNGLLSSAPALKKLQLLGYTSLICSGFIQQVPCGYDSSTVLAPSTWMIRPFWPLLHSQELLHLLCGLQNVCTSSLKDRMSFYHVFCRSPHGVIMLCITPLVGSLLLQDHHLVMPSLTLRKQSCGHVTLNSHGPRRQQFVHVDSSLTGRNWSLSRPIGPRWHRLGVKPNLKG